MSIRIDGTNTAANPGITGADADTGLQFGTNEVKIVTGGTDRVTVDNSSATFAGQTIVGGNPDNGGAAGVRLWNGGAISAARTSNGQGVFSAYIVGNSTPTINLMAGGSATFAGRIETGSSSEANSTINAQNNATGNPTIYLRNHSNGPVMMGFSSSSGTAQTSSINADGSATFAGAVTATNTAKAWVNFNGTGTVAIRANHNVSSITDNATGDYTINFSSSLADANYAVTSIGQNVPGVGNNGTSHIYTASAPTASAVRILYSIGNSPFDPDYGNVVIFR